ncbi:T9SS type B sorting domain-containing protein [bacterium]|nr:T9SS type B sorting domain-containing protein [bacterium]
MALASTGRNRIYIIPILFLLVQTIALAQPKNDHYTKAIAITIPDSGWAKGRVQSEQSGFKGATIDINEPFSILHHQTGLDQKSVWYSFELPTARNIKISLLQEHLNIENNKAGFTVYASQNTPPSERNMFLSPPMSVAQFGSSSFCCFAKGKYLIQVVARSSVVDSVYLQLEVKRSCGSYNSLKNAADLNSGSVHFSDLSCAGLDSLGELKNGLGLKTNYVFYGKFETPAYFDQLYMNMEISKNRGYELYEIVDSTNKVYSKVLSRKVKDTTDAILQLKCGRLKRSTAYFFKFYTNTAFSIFRFDIRGKYPTKAANPTNLLSPYVMGKLVEDTYTVEDYYSCNPKAYKYLCPDQNKLFTDTIYGRKRYIDTIKSGYWCTFTIESYMNIDVMVGGDNVSDTGFYLGRYFVYKGDARNGPCNLRLLHYNGFGRRYSECLRAGTYSIFVGFWSKRLVTIKIDSIYSNLVVDDYNLGLGVKVRLNLKNLLPVRHSLFSDTLYPANLWHILNRWGYATRKTPPDHFGGTSQTFYLNKTKTTGNFSFCKFYLDQASYLRIVSTTPVRNTSMVLCGDISKGSRSLYADSILGAPYINYRGYDSPGKVDTGWYTIISWVPGIDTCSNIRPVAQYEIFARPNPFKWICNYKFDRPHLACKLNQGNEIEIKDDSRANNTATYTLYICKENYKKQASPNIYNPADNAKYFRYLAYSVFTITKSMSMYAYNFGLRYQLLRGSILKDSVGIFNDKNVIIERNSSINKCLLERGTYTVIAGSNSSFSNISYTFKKYFKPAHNWARTALDLGELTNTESKSLITPFSCHNTADSTHVGYNNKISQRNFWATASLNKPGVYEIKLYGIGIQNSYIYADTIHPQLNFGDQKKLNMVDSGSTLKLMANGSLYYNKDKPGVERLYFVAYHNNGIVNNNEFGSTDLIFNYKLTIDSLATEKGDYCNNAISTTLTDTLTHELKVWNSIHSLGEGYGEQNKTIYLLDDITTKYYKTTWFKVSINNLEGYNLQLGYDYYSTGTVVYFGSCEALTPIAIMGNGIGNAINCIGKGDYYIQKFYGKENKGFSLERVKLRENSQACKPINTQEVLANFATEGGCNNEPVVFKNLSTQGSNVQYEWQFGDGSSSNEMEPTHQYKLTKNKDSLWVQLVVSNKKTQASDTVRKPIFISKNFLFVPLPSDTVIFCEDSLTIHPFKNSDKIWFSWAIYDGTIHKGKKGLPVFWPYHYKSQITYYMEYANCSASDSFDLYSEKLNPGQLRDYGKICQPGDTTTIGTLFKTRGITYNWSTGDTSYAITVDTIGEYWLERALNHCHDTITFSVQYIDTPGIYKRMPPCENDSLRLQGSSNFLVIDGSDTSKYLYLRGRKTIPFTFIYQSNDTKRICLIADTLHFDSIISFAHKLHDTLLCANEKITLDAGQPAESYVWNTGSKNQQIVIDTAGRYVVISKLSYCIMKDKATVKLPPDMLPTDTNICDSITPFQITSVKANKYNWNNGSNSRSIVIKNFGSYILQAQYQSCLVTDTFQVTQNCPSQLFVPNAFSPNGDAVNPTFLAKGTHIEDFEMWIFARNGQVVYYSTDIAYGWDGMVNGEPAPLGSYYYVIKYTVGGNENIKNGQINLIK